MTWIEDPASGAGIFVPDDWTLVEGSGKIPLVAVDASAGPGVYAPNVVVSIVSLEVTDTLHDFADRNWEAWRVADSSAIVVSVIDGELDGVPVRETLVSTLVGSSGLSTFSHYVVTNGLGVRFDVSAEAWDTASARELARSILAQAQLPVRDPAASHDADDLRTVIASAFDRVASE